ncbi:MAG TPA: hypothetical protein PKH47_06370 [Anaerolineales bacterium]|nr:hypothetical protein [Anaerolineales bacterium]
MQKWEYTTLLVTTDVNRLIDELGVVAKLNNKGIEDYTRKQWGINSALQQLGDEGWELVNVMWVDASSTNRVYVTAYYLKRPKP